MTRPTPFRTFLCSTIVSMPRRRLFKRLGEIGAEQLELPAGRMRQLQLAASWRRVAGELVARRAPVLAIRRGVLEVRVEEDEGWVKTLEGMIPTLIDRLAAEYPGLGIKKVRLVRGDVAEGPGPS